MSRLPSLANRISGSYGKFACAWKGALACLFIAGICQPAEAAIYNLADDFSATSNVEGDTWTYRIKSGLTRDGNYNLIANAGTDLNSHAGMNGWTQGWLQIIKNYGSDRTDGFSYLQAAGGMFIHPEPSSLGVITWTSPGIGTVDIEFEFGSVYFTQFGDGLNWFVDKNATELAAGTYTSSTGILNLPGVSVVSGDQIHFIFEPKGSIVFDSSKLFAQIDFTPVPEPASGALSLMGLAACGLLVRRKR